MKLRPYQFEAVAAVYSHLRECADNPCVVIPTAGGKTPVMATICNDAVSRWGGRVLILAHVKELLEQAAEKLRLICPDVQVGVYSAGLGSRDKDTSIVVAGIQSVYKRACDLGAFDLVLVDEAHLIPLEGDGMYRQFLADMRVINPAVRVIGLTATPFRMKAGLICAPDHFLNSICYEIGIRELIRDGYLCQLVSKAGRHPIDTSALHVRAGEYIASEVEALMDSDAVLASACNEITEYMQQRHSCLVFAAGVAHAEHVTESLAKRTGDAVGLVVGSTLAFERQRIIDDFKAGHLRYLVNVNVLTTGFDAPCVDCVAILRPTLSPGLYYQMVGRGFRLHPGKTDCLVLDYGGNVLRHGPVDQIKAREPRKAGARDGAAPAKACPKCMSLIAAGYAICPDCGYRFPEPDTAKHDATATEAGILSGEVTTEVVPIQGILHSVHEKRDAPPDHPKTMRIEYQLSLREYVSEWVCPEHTGFARAKFEAWWAAHSQAPVPATAQGAVDLAESGAMAEVKAVEIRTVTGQKWPTVIGYELGDIPAYREPGWDEGIESEPVVALADLDDDDIPF